MKRGELLRHLRRHGCYLSAFDGRTRSCYTIVDDRAEAGASRMLKVAIPVLHVTSSVTAEAFYAKLGFKREFAYRPTEAPDPCYMGVVRDDAKLHLSSFADDGVAGSLVFLVVDDVDALHRELLNNGVSIELSPTDQTWGNREMYVRDADRNKIAFVRPGTD